MRDWVKQAEVDAGERDGLTRNGMDPVTVHPFIEAEKRAGHSVKRACELPQVSRAAYYARRTAAPARSATPS